jgi:hypothetical protein
VILNEDLSNISRDPVLVVGPFAFLAVNLVDFDRSAFVTKRLLCLLKRLHGWCFTFEGIQRNMSVVCKIVAALQTPLVIMNVILFWIAGTSVVARVKNMNLAVRATQKSNQILFKQVISLRANRVDQAILLGQQTVRVAHPLGTIAMPSHTTFVRACEIRLKNRAIAIFRVSEAITQTTKLYICITYSMRRSTNI